MHQTEYILKQKQKTDSNLIVNSRDIFLHHPPKKKIFLNPDLKIFKAACHNLVTVYPILTKSGYSVGIHTHPLQV